MSNGSPSSGPTSNTGSNRLRPHWSGRLAFVLAAAGSAIGLGNIWKFPYITGVHGGGAFVLVYLACIAFVGLPIFMSELFVGQAGQRNVVGSFEAIHKPGTIWRMPGWVGLASAILILSFYSVVGGWVFDFELRSLLGEFGGQSDDFIKGRLGSLLGDPGRQTIGHTLFMIMVLGITLGGVKQGLEKWNKILMPALLGILALLFIRVMFLDGFSKALTFLFEPDFSKLHAESILEAVGHSFFTLSLGMGAILTYGSYLSKHERLPRIALTVGFLDTIIALVAGIVIFSVVFSFDLEAGSGPGLIFATLPLLFAKMPGGYILSVAFFLLVGFAALTSAVSILEVIVAYVEEKWSMTRKKATLLSAFGIYALGFLSVFSTNKLSDFKLFGKYTFFDFFDKLTSSYLLPIGGLLMSLFVGWILGEKAIKQILAKSANEDLGTNGKILLWSLRLVAPGAVLTIIIKEIIS